MMYDKEHQLFLSYILRKGYLPADKALNICKDAAIGDVTDIQTLKHFISAINSRVEKHSLHISIGRCEITGDLFVILNDVANDDISKLQMVYKPIELEYFQSLLKGIVCAKERKLPQINCLNISSTLSGRLPIADAEILLTQWETMGYLIINDSDVCLGIRCISEFAPYFKKYCGDYIKNCALCSETVFSGKNCGHCKERMHFYCIENFLQQETCPNCKNAWNHLAEDAEEMSSEED